MATNDVDIQFVPDAETIDFVPDEPTSKIDFVPDDSAVAKEALKASAGAVQALDVMSAPRNFDWTDINARLDEERFRQSESLRAQAAQAEDTGSGTGPGSEAFGLRQQASSLREQITPFTPTGQRVEAAGAAQLQGIEDVGNTAARPNTPASALTSFLGPGLAPTVMPVVESAGRNIGAATGGALGAAIGTAATAATGGAFPIIYGLGGALLGSYAGGQTQEGILQTAETPEETQTRHQRAIEDAAANPNSERLGGMVATLPFFGPSLAQMGRALMGDRGAMRNLAIAGTLGAGTAYAGAKVRGEDAKPEDIAEAFFVNTLLGETTKLGRKLGLHPSSEQAALEEAQAKYGETIPPLGKVEPDKAAIADVFPPAPERVSIGEQFPQRETQPIPLTGGDPNAVEISPASPPDGGVRPPEVPQQNEPLPAPEGGEGVQPSGQGEPLAEAAPEAPREVVSAPETATEEAPPTPAPESTGETPSSTTPESSGAVETSGDSNPTGDGSPTSIKNAVVAEERAARGISPAEEPARRAFGEVWDAVKQEVAKTPAAPDVLIAELKSKPRALTDREDALLLHKQIELQNAFDTAAEEVNRATDAGDEPTRAEAIKKLNGARDALSELYDINKSSGTETGRGLNARKMMANSDYSLAKMETKLRAEQGGVPLSEKQVEEVRQQFETITRTQKELDARLAEVEARNAGKGVDELIQKTEAETPLDPAVKSLADRIIARLDVAAANAAKSLRASLANLGSAPDPAIILHVAKIAAAKTAKGAIKFAQWSAEMIAEFGEKVRPFLQAGWDQRDQHIEAELDATAGAKKKTVAARVRKLDESGRTQRLEAALDKRIAEGGDIRAYVQKLAEQFVRNGINEREALIDAVHARLSEKMQITREAARDLISGYGQSTPLSKEPAKVTLRDLKGQMQQVAKLEKLAAGEPLKKTGPERRVPSATERSLIKQVNAAKKKLGVVVTDPETQLKSTLDSVRTRLRNELEDMTLEIETGEKPPQKTEIQYTQDIEILKGLRDRVRETLRSLDDPKVTTDEQRIATAKRALETTIKATERRLAGAEPTPRRTTPNTPELAALRAKHKALKAQLAEVDAADAMLQENKKAERLVQQIESVEKVLAGNEAKTKPQGADSQLVAEAKDQLAKLREQLSTQRASDPARQAEAIDRAEKTLERGIAKLDADLQAGKIATVGKKPSAVQSERLDYLRAQKAAMVKLRQFLRDEARPRMTAEQLAIKQRLSFLAKSTADLQSRVATGTLERPKRVPRNLDHIPEYVKAKAENEKAKADYDKALYEARKAARSTQQKIRDTVADTLGASRSIYASTDISAPGRQGIMFALPDLLFNPKRISRQFLKMLQVQFSEAKYQENDAAIKSRDNADLYKDADLYIADLDHKPSAREEQFKSEIAEKVPILGRFVRGSNRGFSGFMNTLRADAMDAFVSWAGGRENVSPETAKYLAAAINDLSGRGNSSRKAQGAMEWLAKYFFSPRLWVSRFNTALLKPVWRDPLNRDISLRARGVVALQYAKFVAALAAIRGLASLWGGKMEEDPRDSDFGKLQMGEKRYDVMGGIGNMVTLLARIASRSTKIDGKELSLSYKGDERPERELGQILFQHLRNKSAPVPGAVYDYIYGRHPDRSKVTAGSLFQNLAVPGSVSDAVGFFRQENPAAALRDTIINATGVSVRDYSK